MTEGNLKKTDSHARSHFISDHILRLCFRSIYYKPSNTLRNIESKHCA